jgi:hypothetical protein
LYIAWCNNQQARNFHCQLTNNRNLPGNNTPYNRNTIQQYNTRPNSSLHYNTNTIPLYNTNTTPRYNTNTTPRYNTNSSLRYNTNTTPRYNTNTTPRYNTNSSLRYNKTPPHGTTQTPPHGTIQTVAYGTTRTPPHGTIQTVAYGTTQTPPHGTIETVAYGTTRTPPHGTTQTVAHGTTQTPPHGTIQTVAHGTTQTVAYGTTPHVTTHPSPITKPTQILWRYAVTGFSVPLTYRSYSRQLSGISPVPSLKHSNRASQTVSQSSVQELYDLKLPTAVCLSITHRTHRISGTLLAGPKQLQSHANLSPSATSKHSCLSRGTDSCGPCFLTRIPFNSITKWSVIACSHIRDVTTCSDDFQNVNASLYWLVRTRGKPGPREP